LCLRKEFDGVYRVPNFDFIFYTEPTYVLTKVAGKYNRF
jgi:hypothetical protein